MAQWVSGQVVDCHHWNGRLHSLRVEADIAPFEAGQFTRLGLEIDGSIVGRPYSLVNAPQERPLDFYFIVVPGGPLSPRLAALPPGAAILVAAQATGFMTLKEVPASPHLWLISTGTGVGPFLSILKTATPWQRYERVVLVHAVRTVDELNYADTIRQVATAYPRQFTYIPFVSREACAYALPGRIPQAIENGSLEQKADIAFSADNSQVMLCGNPDMVEDTRNMLIARGMRKHSRREPGQISMERYW